MDEWIDLQFILWSWYRVQKVGAGSSKVIRVFIGISKGFSVAIVEASDSKLREVWVKMSESERFVNEGESLSLTIAD